MYVVSHQIFQYWYPDVTLQWRNKKTVSNLRNSVRWIPLKRVNNAKSVSTSILLPTWFFFSGHFTQVVWKDSQELGIARARTRDGKWLVVANYLPAGNFIGRYPDNVFPPISRRSPPPIPDRHPAGQRTGESFYIFLWLCTAKSSYIN